MEAIILVSNVNRLIGFCVLWICDQRELLPYLYSIYSMLFVLLLNVINLMAAYCCCWRSCCLLIFFLQFVVRFCFLFIFIHIINFHSFLFILLSVIITLLFTLPVIISTFLLIYFYCFFIIAVIIQLVNSLHFQFKSLLLGSLWFSISFHSFPANSISL